MNAPITCTAVVPCYNAGKYIGAVLASLLRQTRPPDELLLIDDGSTDGSLRIAESFPQVKIVRHERNAGLAQARNTAIEAASGEVLVFVDSDAPADRHLVERLLAHYGPSEVAGVGGRGIEVARHSQADLWRGNHSFAQTHGELPLEVAPFLYGLCSSYRKDVLKEVGGFDLFHRTNAEDVDIGIRIREKGYRLVYEPKALVWHQRRDTVASVIRMAYRYDYWAFAAIQRHREQPAWFPILEALRSGKRNILRDVRVLKNPVQLALSLAAMAASLRAAFGTLKFRRGE